jgi:hypothetical protein
MLVMKKALELNYLTRNRLGFSLAIDPASTFKKTLLQRVDSVDLTLYFSKSFAGLRLDQFRQEIKDFVQVASNVQSQLKAANDSRLGVFPQSIIAVDHDMDCLKRPEVMVPMMSARLPKRKPSPPPSPVLPRLTRSTSLTNVFLAENVPLVAMSLVDRIPMKKPRASTKHKPIQPARANSVSAISIKSFSKQNLMKHFDSPAEAKLFETYKKKKVLYVKQSEKESKKETKSNGFNGDTICGNIDQKCVVSLTSKSSLSASVISTPYPDPDWDDKTPIISNRKRSEDSALIESEHRAAC